MTEALSIWNDLSADSAQVLICDLQREIVARSKTTTPDALGKSAGVLCQIARLFTLPTLLSVVPEGDKAPELIAELQKEAGFANQYLRATASPFLDPATTGAIAANGRKLVIIAGFATEVVVLHAALDAVKAGYRVLVAVDASGGMSQRTEMAALLQMESAGVVISSVVSLATKLAPVFTTTQGKEMFALVQQLRLA